MSTEPGNEIPTQPAWLRRLETARNCRAAGVVLTFNTADRTLVGGDSSATAMSLKFALARNFAAAGYHVLGYSSGQGVQALDPQVGAGGPRGASPASEIPTSNDSTLVLSHFDQLLRRHREQSPVVVILEYAEHLAPGRGGSAGGLRQDQAQALEIIHSWGQDDNIKASGNFVVLIAYDGEVSSLLTGNGCYREVRVDLPTDAERRTFIEYLLRIAAQCPSQLGTLHEDMSVPELARLSGGLRLMDIEELLRESAALGESVTQEGVRRLKKRAISQIGRDLVEVVDPEEGFESVAGAQHAKDYFDLIRDPWMSGASGVPQAVLLAGVPGCGKSYLVRAVAHELQVPLLVMRNVRESWVGASERNLERVLWIAENLSPCIMWTDEVDQAIGQRSTGGSGDSGTNERIVARIFEFFGSMEHRGRILWIATTNRPDVLDPALLDRFQVVIPFLHPTRSDREQLLPILARQVGRTLHDDVDPTATAARPELSGLTVRSLQEVLVLAGLKADADREHDTPAIRQRHLELAIDDHRTGYRPADHEFIALTAVQMTSFKSLLPWRAGAGAAEPGEWPAYLDGLVDRDGDLDDEALAARIEELQIERHHDRILR